LHYEEFGANGHRALSTTENFADHHTGFGRLFRGDPLLSLLRTLLGEEMILFKEKINYKVHIFPSPSVNNRIPRLRNLVASKRTSVNRAQS
jgi:hypothetical protein